MHRYFVTGTDTGIGKTYVTAVLARALREAGETVTVVKAVQTGLAPDQEGDAQRAARLAGTAARELLRLRKPADPWSAALAEGRHAPRAAALAEALAAIPGAVVVEGAGGLLVPLNEDETFADLARAAGLTVILAVGLRLGCINHALLTLGACERASLPVLGAVLVAYGGPADADHLADVRRCLQGKIRILGILPFVDDEAAGLEDAARAFHALFTRDGTR